MNTDRAWLELADGIGINRVDSVDGIESQKLRIRIRIGIILIRMATTANRVLDRLVRFP